MIKESDFYFVVPTGTSFWPSDMHEPLTVFISFPLLSQQPWRFSGVPLLEELDRKLRKVWPNSEGRARSLLCQLCLHLRQLQSMSESMVRSLLYRTSWKRVPDQEANG